MRSRLIFLTLVLSLLALTPSALGPRHAATAAPTVVNISAQLTGPSGTVTLQAHLLGTPAALAGTGAGIHQDFASEARFALTGTVVGSSATLGGVVTQAKYGFLLGAPVTVTADLATGEIVHTFGPIPSGPLAGVTLAFSGTGVVLAR